MSLKTELYKTFIPEVQRRLEENKKRLRILHWMKDNLLLEIASVDKADCVHNKKSLFKEYADAQFNNRLHLMDSVVFIGKRFNTVIRTKTHLVKKFLPPSICDELHMFIGIVNQLNDSDQFTKMDVVLAIDKLECEKIELKELYSELLDKAYPNRKDKRDKWLDVIVGNPPTRVSRIKLNRFGQIVTNRKNAKTE